MTDDPDGPPAAGGTTGAPNYPTPAPLAFTGPPVSYIHSDVFDRVVKSDDDIVGLVAYGLYQQRKRQWLRDYEAENNRKPCVVELQNFSFGFRGGTVDSLREEAEGQIVSISEALIEEKLPEMQERAFDARTTKELEQLKEAVAAASQQLRTAVTSESQELKTAVRHVSTFRHHIVGHAVGFVVLVFLVYAATIVGTHEPHVGAWAAKMYDATQQNRPPQKPDPH